MTNPVPIVPFALDDRQRAGPVALRAAEAEHRMRSPGRGRSDLQRLFGRGRDTARILAERPCRVVHLGRHRGANVVHHIEILHFFFLSSLMPCMQNCLG